MIKKETMQGNYKVSKAKTRNDHKTNFDDWSDPQCKHLAKPKRIFLGEEEESKPGENLEDLPKTIGHIPTATSILIEDLRKKIHDGLPLLSKKEIRNFRLPFYKSLIENLKEDGFVGTSEFMTTLIEIDEYRHQTLEDQKQVQFLKFNKKALKFLCEKLMVAEIAHLENDIYVEMKSMLELAIYFSNEGKQHEWYWLAEEFFEQSEAICEANLLTSEQQEIEAIGKYLYASFLIEKLFRDANKAKLLVDKSMELSKDKSWKCESLTGKHSDILYLDSCLLLHKIYIVMSTEMKSMDILMAIEMLKISLFWAKQIGCKTAQQSALLRLTIICLEAKQFELTLDYLEKYMEICQDLKDILGLCEGLILKADYHELIGEPESVVSNISELLNISEKNSIVKLMALAHRKLASIYLMYGKDKQMKEHAVKAYQDYVMLDAKEDIDEARCLTGIGIGKEIMSYYLDVLLQSDDVNSPEFHLLTSWKQLHIPFFGDVKLSHPEADMNIELSERLEVMKNEEWETANNARQEITRASNMFLSMVPSHRHLTKAYLTNTSGRQSLVSKSVMNFKTQMHRAIGSAVSGSVMSLQHY